MSIDFSSAKYEEGTWAVLHEGPSFNVSNGNAMDLLRVLGYIGDHQEAGMLLGAPLLVPEDAYGDEDPTDFMGRVKIAQGLLDITTDDEHGVPAVQDGGPGTGRAMVVSFGRRPGYLADRLRQLEEIAQDAIDHGAKVTWS